MAQGRTLLADIYGVNEATVWQLMNLLGLGLTQPGTALRTTCSVLDVRYLDLAVDRFDAALALEYGDANNQTFPPDEEDRIERFEAFWGYSRGELETLVSTGNHPEI